MKRLLACLVLLSQSALADKPIKPDWDCDIEVREGADVWSASSVDVSWYRFTDSGAYISVRVFTIEPAQREALRKSGAFDPASRASVSVGPRTEFARKPLWVTVTSGDHSLAPQRVSHSKGFYGTAVFSLEELRPLLTNADGRLDLNFRFADGTVLNRTSISVSELRSSLDRLPALADQYDARVAKPEESCIDHSTDIIID